MTVRRGYREENDVNRKNGSGGSEYKNKSSYGKKDTARQTDAGDDAADIAGKTTDVGSTKKKTQVSRESDIKLEGTTPKRNGAKKKEP